MEQEEKGFTALDYLFAGSYDPRRAQSFTVPDSGDYTGMVQDDDANGFGMMRFLDGSYYEGFWAHGDFDGIGRYHRCYCGSSGEQCFYDYEGRFEHGVRSGMGKCVFSDGVIYAGEFREDRPEGMGFLLVPGSQYYEGEFHEGKQNGMGKMFYPDGTFYGGEYRDGVRCGLGQYLENGTLYEGEFRDDVRSGIGSYTAANGVFYDGEYRDDKWNGVGILSKPDGSRYRGWFKDGMRHGYGTFADTDGTIFRGEFQNDEPTENGIRIPKRSEPVQLTEKQEKWLSEWVERRFPVEDTESGNNS